MHFLLVLNRVRGWGEIGFSGRCLSYTQGGFFLSRYDSSYARKASSRMDLLGCYTKVGSWDFWGGLDLRNWSLYGTSAGKTKHTFRGFVFVWKRNFFNGETTLRKKRVQKCKLEFKFAFSSHYFSFAFFLQIALIAFVFALSVLNLEESLSLSSHPNRGPSALF